MPNAPDTADLAARLPDEPGWVDTRGMLLSGRCQVLARDPDEGFVVVATDWSVASIVGRPAPGLVHEAAQRFHGMRMNLLVRLEDRSWVAPLVPAWLERRVLLHTRHGALPAAAAAVDVRRFDAASLPPLDHLPAELRREIRLALGLNALRVAARASAGGSPAPVSVAAAFVGGLAVAFCYPVWQTERWWDVAVDTLAGHRRRGLAAQVVTAMIAHMAAGGRAPVWGALDDNTPSLGLAARLGFGMVDELAMFTAPAGTAPDPSAPST